MDRMVAGTLFVVGMYTLSSDMPTAKAEVSAMVTTAEAVVKVPTILCCRFVGLGTYHS